MKSALFFSLFFLSLSVWAHRPSNAISFFPQLCICKDGEAVQPFNCSNFCSGKKTNGAEVLFAKMKVSSDISNGELENTYDWCTHIFEGEYTNPRCVLELKSKNNSITYLDLQFASANSLNTNVSSIPYDEVFSLTLVEITTGAKSNPVKIVKFSDDF